MAGFNAQTLGYTASSNRMSAFNGTSVTYDGLGNVTGGVSAAALSYGANTRLAQIAEYSNDLYLTYNGLGELARTLQTTEDGCGSTTEINREYYHFATDGRALGLVQEQGSRVQWDWLWLDNLPVLQFEDSYDGAGTLIGTTVTYLHPDHLGTPRIGTDTAGAIQWRYRSDGFGTLTNANSREVRLRLPGQIALGLGAINYNYFRDYDPSLGRYLESDPIGLDGGLNSYAYVDNNPLKFADPYGLFPFPILPKTDDCKISEWKECEARCAPQAVKGCYVTLKWKLRGIRGGEPIRSEERTVNCRCDEPRQCPPMAPEWKQYWWVPFVPLLTPWPDPY